MKKQPTVKQIKQMHIMAEKGITDSEIAKEVGFCVSTVQKITTRFWDNKMKSKHENS